MMLSYTAEEKDEGRKVYHILRNELSISAALVRRLKNSKGIYLNGEPAYTTVRVAPGDVISADVIGAEKEPDIEPEDGELNILYENEGFIAVNKPCGMLVHPSRARFYGSLAGIAAGYFKRTGQNSACHVVNRLDRDTSGIVLIAKSAHYKTLLAEALHEDTAEKRYIALLSGTLPQNCGVIDAPIKREEEQKMRRIVASDGQRAVTEYTVKGTAEAFGFTIELVEFVLKTGRTHQIRVHSSYMGAPLLGDGLYGDGVSGEISEKLGISAQALHAFYLRFRDPVTGKLLELTAPIERSDFTKVIEAYF